MKKLAVLLVFAVVVVFSAPALAQNPFADVPADHWAYDAVTQAVAGGIITGFPDGTYKGAQNLTRYEVAMIIARILDSIEQERQTLLREVESMDVGLSTTVEAMEEMVEADIQLLSERMGVEVETVKRAVTADVDVLRADITSYIDALEARLGTKIVGVESSLGAKVDAVDAKVDGVASGVDAVDAKVDGVDAKVHDVDAKVESFLDELADIDFWIDILFEQLDFVDGRVDEVAYDVASVQDEMGDVSADVAAVDAQINQVVADVTAVDSKVVSVAAEVRDMNALISDLQSQLDGVYSDMDLYYDYLLDLEFWVDILFDEMGYIDIRLDEVAEKAAAVDTKVDNLVAELDRKIQRVAADVRAVEADVAGLAVDVEDKLAALAADMDAKLAAIDAVEAKAQDAAAKADAVAARVDALAADMDAGFDRVADDVAAVDARVDALAADVAEKLEGISADLVDEVAADVAAVDARVDGLASDMDARMREMAAGLDAVDIKVDILGDKVDEVDAKVDALDARTVDMVIQLGEMEEEILARIAKNQRELSAAQATQVVAIVERMLERHEPDVTKEEVMEMIEGLNALIDEFADELTVILEGMEREIAALRFVPAQVVDLERKAAELDERVAALEDPFLQFAARTSVIFRARHFEDNAPYYQDPFDTHDADGNLVDYDPKDQVFEQTVDLDMALQREGVTADLNVGLVGNVFSLGARDNFGLASLVGVVETDEFRADLRTGHGYTLTSYLFNDGDGRYDGMIVTVDDNRYAVFADDNNLQLAMSYDLDLALPVTLYLGLEDTIDDNETITVPDPADPTQDIEVANPDYEETIDRNVLVGLETEMQLAMFDVTAIYAFSGAELGNYNLNLIGDTTFAERVDFTADLLLRDADFTAIEGADGEAQRLNLTTSTSFHPVDLSLRNNLDFLNDITTNIFRAEVLEENAVTFATFDAYAHVEVAASTADAQAGHSRFFTAYRSFLQEENLDFAAIYEHFTGGATYVGTATQRDELRFEADYDMSERIDVLGIFRVDMLNDITNLTLEVDYDFSETLDFHARMVTPNPDTALTLRAMYEDQIAAGTLDASLTKNINTDLDSLILDANYRKEDFYALFGYDLNLGTGFMFRNDANDNFLNLYAEVDTEKEVTEKLSMNASSRLDKRDWVPDRVTGVGGLLITHGLGLEYQVFDDAAATLDYRYLNFMGDAAGGAEDYSGSVITGGFNVNF